MDLVGWCIHYNSNELSIQIHHGSICIHSINERPESNYLQRYGRFEYINSFTPHQTSFDINITESNMCVSIIMVYMRLLILSLQLQMLLVLRCAVDCVFLCGLRARRLLHENSFFFLDIFCSFVRMTSSNKHFVYLSKTENKQNGQAEVAQQKISIKAVTNTKLLEYCIKCRVENCRNNNEDVQNGKIDKHVISIVQC